MSEKACTIPGCGKRHYGKGFCSAHYKRLRRHGDPLGGGTSIGEPLAFFERAMRSAKPGDCMLWPYAENGVGYGVVSLEGKMRLVHRLACERQHGPAPSAEHQAAHICGKGHMGCFSPFHVRWRTGAENNQDKIAHGTSLRGEKHNLSKLSDHQVLEIVHLRKQGMKQAEIGKLFGIKQPTVSNILTGDRWGWLTQQQEKNNGR